MSSTDLKMRMYEEDGEFLFAPYTSLGCHYVVYQFTLMITVIVQFLDIHSNLRISLLHFFTKKVTKGSQSVRDAKACGLMTRDGKS